MICLLLVNYFHLNTETSPSKNTNRNLKLYTRIHNRLIIDTKKNSFNIF